MISLCSPLVISNTRNALQVYSTALIATACVVAIAALSPTSALTTRGTKQFLQNSICSRDANATIKSDVKKYIDKHDRLRHSISVVLDETQKKELQSGYDVIDELSDRLHRQVYSLQMTLKHRFKVQAERKWTAAANACLIDNAEKALDAARTARAALEHEMRRAELYELHMAEGSREMDVLADRIANFMQLDVQLPSASDFGLRDLKEQLKGSVAAFETDVTGKVDDLLSRVNKTQTLRLTETGVISEEQLKIQSDAFDSIITGVVQPNINSLLLLDGWNSSLKKLDTGDTVAKVCLIS